MEQQKDIMNKDIRGIIIKYLLPSPKILSITQISV